VPTDRYPYDATNDAAPPDLFAVSLTVRVADEYGELFDALNASVVAGVAEPEGMGPLSFAYRVVDEAGAVAEELPSADGVDPHVAFTMVRVRNLAASGGSGLFLLVEVRDDFTGGVTVCALPSQIISSSSRPAVAVGVPCPEVVFTPYTSENWLRALLESSEALAGASTAELQLHLDAVDECV
jgi:hypothetical protein